MVVVVVGVVGVLCHARPWRGKIPMGVCDVSQIVKNNVFHEAQGWVRISTDFSTNTLFDVQMVLEWTALHWAAERGYAAIAALLIENGALVNACSWVSTAQTHHTWLRFDVPSIARYAKVLHDAVRTHWQSCGFSSRGKFPLQQSKRLTLSPSQSN